MKKLIIFLLVVCNAHGLFDYDRAVHSAQKEQWAQAGQQFKTLVTEQPDNPELLYDAGVVAFQNEDLMQAKALFEAAAQNEKASRTLKEQAYFNKGNTHVKAEELKEALLSYEQTLMLNPENEHAKHNHETVKKILDQQEQQQQEKNNQENKDQNKDQQDNQNQDQQQSDQQKQDNDQNKEDDQEQDSNDCNDCQGKDEQSKKDGQQDKDSSPKDGDESSDDSQESEGDEQKQDEQPKKGNDDRLDQQGDQEDEKEGGPDKEEQQSQQDNQRDKRNEFNKNTEDEEQKQQQEKQFDHDQSLGENEDDAQQQDMQGEQKEQDILEQEEAAQPVQQLDPALERVLEKREGRDAQLNKRMVKALVSHEMAGQDGQNCW
ncbi:MAG: hypothetical protein WD055_05790 [Candidatus Dependentiae bacterium]